MRKTKGSQSSVATQNSIEVFTHSLQECDISSYEKNCPPDLQQDCRIWVTLVDETSESREERGEETLQLGKKSRLQRET